MKTQMETLWIVALVAMTTSGCAVVDENNRPMTRFFDQNAAPDSKGVRLALAPIAIPVGMTTLAIDAVLINPVLQLPEAFSETMGLVSAVDSTGQREIVVFPVRLVAPGRRGYHWVKWVESVEVSAHSPWWQSPLPLQ